MGLEAGNGRGGRSGMSGKQAELSDYGRAHIWVEVQAWSSVWFPIISWKRRRLT